MIQRTLQAMQALDADAASACFCDEAEFSGTDGRLHIGRAAICALFASYFLRVRRLTFSHLRIDAEPGQARVRYHYCAEGTDGKRHERDTTVIVRMNDGCIASWLEYRE